MKTKGNKLPLTFRRELNLKTLIKIEKRNYLRLLTDRIIGVSCPIKCGIDTHGEPFSQFDFRCEIIRLSKMRFWS
jgi:hypothetical protein